jgi:hypothetical protein
MCLPIMVQNLDISKQFMELPSNLPSETLERIFHFRNQIYAIANVKTRRKVSMRFGVPLD